MSIYNEEAERKWEEVKAIYCWNCLEKFSMWKRWYMLAAGFSLGFLTGTVFSFLVYH